MTAPGSTANGGSARRGYLASAGELVAARKFVEAEKELLRALEASPKDLQALNLLALVRYKLGKLEDARATYREIAGAAPQDPGARRNLGLIALKLGRVDEALPELEMAVRLAPNDERAWSYLGYAYAKRGEVVEAAAAFRRAKQDALALELEHAATVRRPPTPSFHFGHISGVRRAADVPIEAPPAPPPPPRGEPPRPPAPPARAEAPVPVAPPLRTEEPPVVETAPPTEVGVPEISGIHGPVALAPPLPAPIAPGEPAAEAPVPMLAPELPPPTAEAVPVPLLAFVLARLGQGPAPASPEGALRLGIVDEAHVRIDAVLAGAGALAWQPAFRRAQGRHGTEPLGEGAAGRFFRLTGSGDVWVAGAPSRWLPVALVDDVLYVREDRVLAFDGGLSWEAGTVPGAGLRMLQFRGRGTVALELDQNPIAIKVGEDRPMLLAGPRLVGWVGRLVPHGARLEAGAPFQLACQGEGVVLLDPGKR